MAVRTVAIKGVRSSRYLCMDEAGQLHGQVSPPVKNGRGGGKGGVGVFDGAAGS